MGASFKVSSEGSKTKSHPLGLSENKVSLSCFLLDDDPIDVRYVTWLLKQVKGYDLEITSASTIQEARRICTSRQFDLYLLDYWMGEEDSISLLSEMDGFTKATKTLVVMSSLDDEAFHSASVESGASLFLAKQDLSEAVLENMLRNVVHIASKNQVNSQQKRLNEEKIYDWTKFLHNELDKVHGFASLALAALNSDNVEDAKRHIQEALAPLSGLRHEASFTNLGIAAIQSRGKVKLQPFDIGTLLGEIVDECRVEAEQFDKNLDYCEHVADSIILSDPHLLKELISMLLRGAIRYGGETTEIAVSYELTYYHLEIYLSEFGEAEDGTFDGYLNPVNTVIHISDLFSKERAGTLFVAEHILQLLNGNWSIGNRGENLEVVCRIPLNYDLLN